MRLFWLKITTFVVIQATAVVMIVEFQTTAKRAETAHMSTTAKETKPNQTKASHESKASWFSLSCADVFAMDPFKGKVPLYYQIMSLQLLPGHVI